MKDFRVNDPIKVTAEAAHHANKKGYFHFMADKEIAVCADEPRNVFDPPRSGYHCFAVKIEYLALV